MSGTNTAIKMVPQSDEGLAQRVKQLRDQQKDIDDEIKFYTGLLQERAQSAGVNRIKAGIYDVLIVEKGRDNFSLSNAKKMMSPALFNELTPYISRSWKEVHVKPTDLGKNTDSDS